MIHVKLQLNSNIDVGPKLQRDILKISLNFRFLKIVLCLDKEKMCRHVLLSNDDRNYRQFPWRFIPKKRHASI